MLGRRITDNGTREFSGQRRDGAGAGRVLLSSLMER